VFIITYGSRQFKESCAMQHLRHPSSLACVACVACRFCGGQVQHLSRCITQTGYKQASFV